MQPINAAPIYLNQQSPEPSPAEQLAALETNIARIERQASFPISTVASERINTASKLALHGILGIGATMVVFRKSSSAVKIAVGALTVMALCKIINSYSR